MKVIYVNCGVKNYMTEDIAVIIAVIGATFETHTSLNFFQAFFS